MNPSELGAPWVPVVVEETAGEWRLPDFVAAVVIHGERHRYVRESSHSRELDAAVRAYRVLHDDSTVGPVVERPAPTTTRRWAVVPPDEGCIVLFADATTGWYAGGTLGVQGYPGNSMVAYMTRTDWLALLAGPSVVEVTPAEYMDAYKATNATNVHPTECMDMVKALNKSLRARATTAPQSLAWITGEAVHGAMMSAGAYGLPWQTTSRDAQKTWNDAAARLREIGGAQ